MLVVDKITGDMVHKHFYDFIDYLNPDDVLILNNTKVIPARLLGKKETGANIEIFLTRYLGSNDWQAIIRNSKRLKDGDIVTISDILKVLIKKRVKPTMMVISQNI